MASPVIWIVNHYAQDPAGAGGTRHFSLAKQLKARGFAPYVFAASTIHNQSHGQRIAGGEAYRVEEIDGVPFVWLRCASYEGNGWQRLKNMLDFGRRVWSKDLTRVIPKPDVVIGSSPTPFAAMAAWCAARRHKAIFFYEIRDLWPLSLIEIKRMGPKHPLALVMSAIERFLSKQADRILVVQQRLDLYLVPRFGVKAERIAYLPNGIDLGLFVDPQPKQPATDFTFMYFGAHGNGNALEYVLQAMQIIERDPALSHIKLRLIGDGPLKPALKALAQSLGLTRVSFEDPIPKRDIPALAAQADVLLFNVVDMPVLDYGISPNKLFDYMASRRPVLFSCNAGTNPIAESGGGITVKAGDAQAIADGMRQLAANDSATLQAMGDKNRAYVSRVHSFDALGEKFAGIITGALSEKR